MVFRVEGSRLELGFWAGRLIRYTHAFLIPHIIQCSSCSKAKLLPPPLPCSSSSSCCVNIPPIPWYSRWSRASKSFSKCPFTKTKKQQHYISEEVKNMSAGEQGWALMALASLQPQVHGDITLHPEGLWGRLPPIMTFDKKAYTYNKSNQFQLHQRKNYLHKQTA